MKATRKQLEEAFSPARRFDSFGPVLERLRLRGFRGHVSTAIEFAHPVTAFSGPNGCGKSTVLEIAACCYVQADGASFQIPHFMPAGALDRAPFASDASVEVTYCQKVENPDTAPRTLTLSRDAAESRWRGYDRRPTKNVHFLGHGRHLPRSERRDKLRDIAETGQVTGTEALPTVVLEKTSTILARAYTSGNGTTLALNTDSAWSLVVSRHGLDCAYSELQMGCGEARVFSLVQELESIAPKSLVLLEEPESAVHFAAQGRLGHYLLDVSLRRGHQILLTTHSEHLLRTLPQVSRIYLEPSDKGVIAIPGLTSGQAASLMSDGFDKAVTVLVEDECAKQVLQQLLEKTDRSLSRSVRVVTGGYTNKAGTLVGSGVENIKNAMATLGKANAKVVAVVDGDDTAVPESFVFKLPGKQAPEKELFASAAVQAMWTKQYELDIPAFLTTLKNVDHHAWFDHLARKVNGDATFLIGEAARAYADGITGTEVPALIAQIKDAASKA